MYYINNEIAQRRLTSNGCAKAPRASSQWLRAPPGRPAARLGLAERLGAPWLARSGLDWLDLAALGALAASICLPWSLLGAVAGSIWLPWAPWLALAGSIWLLGTPWLASICWTWLS